MPGPRPSLLDLLGRAFRRGCPVCGNDHPFTGLLKMRHHCRSCGFVFERENGYFLGSIYLNYGLTAILVTAGVLLLQFGFEVRPWIVWSSLLTFCLIFPFWFFRYSRLLWSAFDVYWDPPGEEDFVPRGVDPDGPDETG